MSETVKVGRNRPPQNGWASKEEVNELRAEVAELRETNQKMLEEIKGLRAELGGAKRRHFLGAVATSAAAFFGKFFHRGEDLGDIPEKKLGKRENKRGAHAKGKEKSDTPIASARKDEKSKNNSREKEEKEDKQNKDKHPLAKKVAAFALAALMVGGSIAGISQCSNHDINGSDAAVMKEMDNKDLENPAFGSTQASAEENDAAKAEAAHQQQLAETMGMSVEEMHAVADRHGVNYNDIGTVNAQDQMRDNMESDYNLSEKIDLDNMSEAERSERSKQEILFANMNNKYVTAQISSARLGAHDASDSELTRQLFEQYEENDAVWQEHAKENAKLLMGSIFSTRLAETSKAYTYGTKNQWDGPIEEQYTTENSGGETIYKVVVTNGDMEIQFKDGCIQAVWGEAAQPQRQVKKRTVVQREVVQQKEEHHREAQGELRKEEHGQEEGERRTPPSDAKDEHADDTQEDAENKATETPRSTDQAEASKDKQADKDGDGLPDSSGKSKSNNGEDDINGRQGDTGEDRPANKNNTEADNGGSGSGEHVAGGGATDTGSGNQGGSGEGGTGSNRADSGGGGKETSQNSQEGSSSWTRKWGSKESSSWRIGSDGKKVESSESSSYDTGRVERNGDSNDAANGDVELLSSVPIRQQD